MPLYAQDDFESDSLSKIWSQRLIAPGSLQLQSEIVRSGKKAVRITVHKGDMFSAGNSQSKANERGELTEVNELWSAEGVKCCYSFSLFLPQNFPLVPTRLVLAQWKQYDKFNSALVDNPLIALRYVNGVLYITLQTTEKKTTVFQTNDDVRGRWLDFVFTIAFTRTHQGMLSISLNEKDIVKYTGPTAYPDNYNYPSPGRFYFKFGLYRDAMPEPMTVYFDQYRKETF